MLRTRFDVQNILNDIVNGRVQVLSSLDSVVSVVRRMRLSNGWTLAYFDDSGFDYVEWIEDADGKRIYEFECDGDFVEVDLDKLTDIFESARYESETLA